MGKQIIFDNLTVKLKEIVLYQNLDLTVEDMDRYIFLGPNGIGKSLLFELLFLGNSRELHGRYNKLSITGRILDASGNDLLNPLTPRKYAYVSQIEDFYKGMTVKEICETACRGVGIELNEGRLNYLLDRFGILEKKNERIKNNVSFGEGKIIHIISRLLKLDATSILLLDEPLNHLSFKNSKVLNDLIKEEIQRNPNLIVLMISHCRAMDFTNKSLVYNTEKRTVEIKPYHSYDCFAVDELNDHECQRA